MRQLSVDRNCRAVAIVLVMAGATLLQRLVVQQQDCTHLLHARPSFSIAVILSVALSNQIFIGPYKDQSSEFAGRESRENSIPRKQKGLKGA